MKITKEELIKQNAVLKQNNTDLGEQNEKLKADMCRVLGFSFYTNDYGTRKETLQIKSWAEIFSEVGKLKALRDFREFEGNISELEYKLNDLESRIKKEIHPNL